MVQLSESLSSHTKAIDALLKYFITCQFFVKKQIYFFDKNMRQPEKKERKKEKRRKKKRRQEDTNEFRKK